MQAMQLVSDVFQITGPVFGLVLIGMWLKHQNIIDDSFIKIGSNLTFKAAMPTLIFMAMLQTDLSESLRGDMALFLWATTLGAFVLAWLWAIKFVQYEQRGIFTQAAYRANSAVVGTALATNLYGDLGVALSGVLLSGLMPLLVVPSAIVLATYGKNTEVGFSKLLMSVVKNPLMIGLALVKVGTPSLAGCSLG
ncbi:MAG: AEC family transporter, partial [Pontibacterium sp.]